jgi:hypothetical protein
VIVVVVVIVIVRHRASSYCDPVSGLGVMAISAAVAMATTSSRVFA